MNNDISSLQMYILKQVQEKNISHEDAKKYLKVILNQENTSLDHEEIAVVGVACDFPKSKNPAELWKLLENGKDASGVFPKTRKNDVVRVSQEAWDKYSNCKTRPGCFLDSVDTFDHAFFNLAPSEAKSMSPEHRLFLEVSWEALENAGYTRSDLKGKNFGTYVGSSGDMGYEKILPEGDPEAKIGNTHAILASRINYVFGLTGPSLVVDTSCSSALVALHLACQAISNKECKAALVGGVSLSLLPVWNELSAMGNESSDGKCKSFDASADGTNIAEGVGALVIKPLSEVIKDKNYIYAVIKGSAINSDGTSNGLTAPNPKAQTEVILKAWKNSKINPLDLSYIEAHGTATKLGDPIEVKGLTDAFKKFTDEKKFCPIGSIKTNIGHLDAAAGIAGVLKLILSMQHKQLPASLHFKEANPLIDFENSSVFVNNQLNPISNKPFLAGISSFGISGTNAHLVLSSCEDKAEKRKRSSLQLFCLSARSQNSLQTLVGRYIDNLSSKTFNCLATLCYSAAITREHYEFRTAFIVETLEDLLEQLKFYLEPVKVQKIDKSSVEKSSSPTDPSNVKLKQYQCAYLSGKNLNHKSFYNENDLQFVPLPPTPFESVRHWPALKIEQESEPRFDPNELLFDLNWIPKKIDLAAERIASFEKDDFCLIYNIKHPLGNLLSNRLREEGMNVISIYVGDKYEYKLSDESTFYLKPTELEHYERLFNDIGSTKLMKVRKVFHLWNLLESKKTMNSLDLVTNSPYEGAISLFCLAKLVCKHQMDHNMQLNVITSKAHKVTDSDREVYPTRSVLVGLNKVITQELPKIATYTIDLDFEVDTPEIQLSQIFSELEVSTKFRDDLVAYRNEKRYLQYLSPMPKSKTGSCEFITKEGDVYLFAGGAGYLGVQTCIHLAGQQKNLTFVLINRSAIPPKYEWDKVILQESETSRLHYQIKGFKQIEELGSRVIYKQASVTNYNEMSSLIENIRKEFGHIDGALLAMKDIYIKTIEDMPIDEYKAALDSKLRGTLILDQLTRKDNLHFFINFASISSIMAGPVNSDCTSVNAFLDTFGDWRNQFCNNTFTLNLTEILTEDKRGTEQKITMLPPIPYEAFLSGIDQILKRGLAYAVLAEFDYKIMQIVLPKIKIRFSADLLETIQSESSVQLSNSKISPDEFNKESVINKLFQIWKEVLGYDQVTLETDFFDTGGTSITALKFLRLIEASFGVKFEVDDLYTCSTVDQMYERINELYHEETKDDLMELLDNLEKETVSLEEASSELSR